MANMVLDGASPRSRSTDPVTSVDAGRLANLPGSQALVWWALGEYGPCTMERLEEAVPGYSPQRVRTALAELREQGFAQAAEGFGTTRYGRRAHLWERAT